jgi:hypothetical protein
MNQKPGALLNDMKTSLQKIKTLVAWQELKRTEHRPDLPPSFEMYDPVDSDLNIEYSHILMMISHFQHTFYASKIRTIKIVRIRQEFSAIKQEIEALNVPARVSGYL